MVNLIKDITVIVDQGVTKVEFFKQRETTNNE